MAAATNTYRINYKVYYTAKRPLWYTLIVVALLNVICLSGTLAQTQFNGVIFNTVDSSVVSYAVIRVEEADLSLFSDSLGRFSFPLAKEVKKLQFTISVSGHRFSVTHTRQFADTERVYVHIEPYLLQEAKIVGLSARDIVKKAVRQIPVNYADSSYFANAFYRQYQQINDLFVNLIEAQHVVMFKVTKGKEQLHATEAYAVQQLRRTHFYHDEMNRQLDNVADQLEINPVYHLANSSLVPGKLDNYRFHFDSVQTEDEYVISYLFLNYSAETFGFVGLDIARCFPGCVYETGQFVIDRKTFAFRHIERKTVRNPGYSFYGSQINFIFPEKKYFYEFKDAALVVDYVPVDGKWYLRKLCHRYATDFYFSGFGNKDCTIEDNFEWQCDSISRYIPEELVHSFYPRLRQYGQYNYDAAFWQQTDFPFYFHPRAAVYKGLDHWMDVEAQFLKEGQH